MPDGDGGDGAETDRQMWQALGKIGVDLGKLEERIGGLIAGVSKVEVGISSLSTELREAAMARQTIGTIADRGLEQSAENRGRIESLEKRITEHERSAGDRETRLRALQKDIDALHEMTRVLEAEQEAAAVLLKEHQAMKAAFDQRAKRRSELGWTVLTQLILSPTGILIGLLVTLLLGILTNHVHVTPMSPPPAP